MNRDPTDNMYIVSAQELRNGALAARIEKDLDWASELDDAVDEIEVDRTGGYIMNPANVSRLITSLRFAVQTGNLPPYQIAIARGTISSHEQLES